MKMLHASAGKTERNQINMEVLAPVKPSVVSVTGMQTLQPTRVSLARSEELCFLPIASMATKPSHYTISSNDKKNTAMATKSNLHAINMVQINNNGKTNAVGTAPIIQLMPSPNAGTLLPTLTILKPSGKTAAPNPQASVLLRPAATPQAALTIPAQNGVPNLVPTTTAPAKSSTGSPVAITTLMANAAPNAKVPVNANFLQTRTPLMLSKEAVQQIRFKIGHVGGHRGVQLQKGIVSKPLSSNNNIANHNNNNNKPETKRNTNGKRMSNSPEDNVAKTTPTTAATTTTTPAMTTTPTANIKQQSEQKAKQQPVEQTVSSASTVNSAISKINKLSAVTLNGTKVIKVQVPSAIPEGMPAAAGIEPTVARVQRSKSLAGTANELAQLSGTERRHSVTVMAKDSDAVAQQLEPIETITIDDDDTDDEEQQQQEQQSNQQPSAVKKVETAADLKPATASSSDTDSVSSSDIEEIFVPPAQPVDAAADAAVVHKTQQQPGVAAISILKAESLPLSKEEFEKSLQCDEQVASTSPSSASTSSNSLSAPAAVAQHTPFARPYQNGAAKERASSQVAPPGNSLSRKMLFHFNMVHWREQDQIGFVQNSKLRFEQNRFNLLQISERCERRQGPAIYFERALFDRIERRPIASQHPLLYLCDRCNCHGPAADFLAPHFCSLSCVRRAQKRRLPTAQHAVLNKMSRIQGGTDAYGAPQQQQSHINLRPFRWTEYLRTKGNGKAAPIHMFLNPFPISPNCFEAGMKLEAIDPENCSLFCVCTIAEVRGYRLKLHFDGYSPMYDFWVNADSMDIFPAGWCEHTKRVLQPPKGYTSGRFTWYRYMVKTQAKTAPRALFTHLNMAPQPGMNGFMVGMHIEAEDLNDTGKICVATVADIICERIRVHFDGWDDCYDFWVHVSSPYIHPCGWHQGRQQLIVPPDYQNAVFNWASYIREVGGIAAPAELFAPREPMEFQPRMKLEVVDQRNPCLIRPATVVTRKGYRVQLHLDCWPSEYYFWLEDDSPDLHPIGWCEATAHELETPPGFLQRKAQMPCDVWGCRGYGNAKRFNLNVHALRDCCPYAPENWRQWRSKTVKPSRVSNEHIIREIRNALPTTRPNSERPAAAAAPMQNNAEAPPKSVRLLPMSLMTPMRIMTAEPSAVKFEAASENAVADDKSSCKVEPLIVESKGAALADVDPRRLNIAKAFVADYGPRMVRSYHLWQKNCDFDMDKVKSNPLFWTSWDVYEYVERAMQSKKIAASLFEEDIDGRALLAMSRDDLIDHLSLKMGPAVKLFSIIVNLRIAVVCKFETTSTGLNMPDIKPTIVKSKCEEAQTSHTPSAEEVSSKSSVKDYNSEDDDMDTDEDVDEEDVVLDNDDFLSVVQCSNANDSDTLMASLPPATVATAS